jgi:hypothetical protein
MSIPVIPLEPTSLLYKDTERDQKSLKQRCNDFFKQDKPSQWKFSVYSAILFFVISSPFLYQLVQSIFGGLFTVAVKGCPTFAGLLLHTIVFILASYGLMQLNL